MKILLTEIQVKNLIKEISKKEMVNQFTKDTNFDISQEQKTIKPKNKKL